MVFSVRKFLKVRQLHKICEVAKLNIDLLSE